MASGPTLPAVSPAQIRIGLLLFAAVTILELIVLHGSVLRHPFLGDDYIFLTDAKQGLVHSLVHAFREVPDYFRPLSREIYFGVLAPLLGDRPLAFRLVSLLFLGAILTQIALVGRALAGLRAGLLAAACFALLYPLHVAIAYVNFAQDLLAIAFSCAAVFALLRGRRLLAGIACLLAALSKESALLLPAILTIWRLRGPKGEGASAWRRVGRETAPGWIAAGIVVGLSLLRSRFGDSDVRSHGLPGAGIATSGWWIVEGARLGGLALLGMEQPFRELLDAFRHVAPLRAVLAAMLAVAITVAARVAAPSPALLPASRSGRKAGWRELSWLGIAWLVIGVIPPVLLATRFNAYYVLFPAVGFAWLLGATLANAPIASAVVAAALAVLNLAANGTTVVRWSPEDPSQESGVSIMSSERERREARYVTAFRRTLEQARPARGTVVYLSQPFGFLMMGTSGEKGPRLWLEDSTLQVRNLRYARTPPPGEDHLFLRYDVEDGSFDPITTSVVMATFSAHDALRAGDFAAGRRILERGIASAGPTDLPERGGLQVELGAVDLELGDTTAARNSWMAALESERGRRKALLCLLELDTRTGHTAAAAEWTRRAVAAYPNDPSLREEIDDIRQHAAWVSSTTH